STSGHPTPPFETAVTIAVAAGSRSWRIAAPLLVRFESSRYPCSILSQLPFRFQESRLNRGHRRIKTPPPTN
ncbi:hypothetical protein LINPERHAP1_LOCUS34032, partial [Linum perenne]